MGSKTPTGFPAEMRNKVSDPDDLATMWKTGPGQPVQASPPSPVRCINHQLNTVNAKTTTWSTS